MTWLRLADDRPEPATYPFPGPSTEPGRSATGLWDRNVSDLFPRRGGSAAGREAEVALDRAQRALDLLTELNDELDPLPFPSMVDDGAPPPAA